jgi:outer membrane immunogenic protein
MVGRLVLAFGAWCALLAAAQAQQSPSADLPSLALDPPPPSPWSGLYVGSDVSAYAIKGRKGMFGASTYVGYDHELNNNFVIGIQGRTGFAPSLFQNNRTVGYDFGEASVKLGYDMGRVMPFVTAGLAVAKPNSHAATGFDSADSFNSLFNQAGKTIAYGSVGAGVEYQINNHLSVSVAVTANAARGDAVAP